MFHFIRMPQFIHDGLLNKFTLDGHLSFFPVFGYYAKCCSEHHYVCLLVNVGIWDACVVSWIGELDLVDSAFLQKWYQHLTRVLAAPHPYKQLVSSLFNFNHSSGCMVVSHCGFNLHFPEYLLYLFICWLAFVFLLWSTSSGFLLMEFLPSLLSQVTDFSTWRVNLPYLFRKLS